MRYAADRQQLAEIVPSATFDDGNGDDDDRYPLEGKAMNGADKAVLMSMPKSELEELLSERAQEVERDRQSRALPQIFHAREAEDAKGKANAAEPSTTPQSVTRPRPATIHETGFSYCMPEEYTSLPAWDSPTMPMQPLNDGLPQTYADAEDIPYSVFSHYEARTPSSTGAVNDEFHTTEFL